MGIPSDIAGISGFISLDLSTALTCRAVRSYPSADKTQRMRVVVGRDEPDAIGAGAGGPAFDFGQE
jgi:hypothetical protein